MISNSHNQISETVIEGFPCTNLQQTLFEDYIVGNLDNVCVSINWPSPVKADPIITVLEEIAGQHGMFNICLVKSYDNQLLQVPGKGLIEKAYHASQSEFERAVATRFDSSSEVTLRFHCLVTSQQLTQLAIVCPPYIADIDSLLLLISSEAVPEEITYQHFSDWVLNEGQANSMMIKPNSRIHFVNHPLSGKQRQQGKSTVETPTNPLNIVVAAWAELSPYLEVADDDHSQVLLSLSGRIFEDFEQVAGPFRTSIPLRMKYSGKDKMLDCLSEIQDKITEFEEPSHISEHFHHSSPECLIAVIKIASRSDFFRTAEVNIHLPQQAKLSVVALIDKATVGIDIKTSMPDLAKNTAQKLAKCLAATVSRANDNILTLTEITERKLPDFPRVESTNTTLLALYQNAINNFSEREAFIGPEDRVDFLSLDKAVSSLAAVLRSKAEPGHRVLVFADRSLDSIVAVFAVLRAGMTYIPILPDNPDVRVEEIIRISCATLAIAQPDSIERAKRLVPDQVIPIRGHKIAAPPKHDRAPDDTAYILFTSGTTGTPKGVAVSDASVINLLEALNDRIYGNENDLKRISLNAPLAFDASAKQIYQLLYGRTLVAIPDDIRRDPQQLIHFINEQDLDSFDTTPTILQAMIDNGFGGEQYPTALRILVGGEPISQKMWDVLSSLKDCSVWNVYGPTEATVNTLVQPVADSVYPSLGRALNNIYVSVIDAEGYIQPEGAVGELLIGGAGVAKGYIGASDKEQSRFCKSASGAPMYHSGDLVRQLHDGTYEFIGRMDNQIKIGAQRLELDEVQSRLIAYPSVKNAAVLLDNRTENLPQIVAAVTPVITSPKNEQDNKLWVTLPNGLSIASVNRNETLYQFKEIFEDKIYTDPTLAYPHDAVVFDVGANIGMFSLFVSQYVPNARIFSFEPLKPIRDRLICNMDAYSTGAKILPFALSDRDGEEGFTYYPGYSMMSSRTVDADANAEKGVISTYLTNASNKGDSEASQLLTNLDEVLDGRFDKEEHRCCLRRLSDVIDEQGVDCIDILKIDVQRAELDVLKGIESRHFKIIRSIALEIHDDPNGKTDGRLREIVELLEAEGFKVNTNQDDLLVGTDRWNCVAWRPELISNNDEVVDFSGNIEKVGMATAEELHTYLLSQLPAYMIPAKIVMMDSLPLTPQGKLDQHQLLEYVDKHTSYSESSSDSIDDTAPVTSSKQQSQLLAIWRKVLKQPQLTLMDDFFLNGGDSIRSIMMQSQARKIGIEISLSQLNETPTIATLIPSDKTTASADSGEGREKMLVLWREILNNSELQENDDFFRMGGDSIRAIMLQSRARKTGVDFNLKDLHTYPIFFEFCNHIFNAGISVTSNAVPTIIPLKDGARWRPSSMQRAMLLSSLSRLDPHVYHNVTVTTINDAYDPTRFSTAVRELRLAHPMLSARLLVNSEGMSFEFDSAIADNAICFDDLSMLEEVQAKAIIRDAVFTERDHMFIPEQGDLLHFAVFKRSDTRFDLLVSEHHSALDGMSLNAMISELLCRYQGKYIETGSDLSVFHALEKQELETKQREAARLFWSEHFKYKKVSPSLASPRLRDDRAKMLQVDVVQSERLASQVISKSFNLGVSHKAILFALHTRALLSVIEVGQSNIGVVYSLRPEVASSETAIGMFLNVLPVPSEAGEIVEIARQFDRFDREVFQYKSVPLETLADWIGAHAQIDNLFNFIRFAETDTESSDIHDCERRYFAVDACVPIAVDWDMSGKKLAVGFQYDTQRISDDFAQQFKATLLYEIENLETLGETNVDEVLNGFGLIRNDGCKSLTEIGLSSLEQLCLLGAINNRLGISLNEVDFFALCTVDDVFGVVDHHVCLRHTHFVKLTNGQRKTDLRIFGFPLAGVAASVFDPWCHMLPDNIAVHALAYPEPSVLSRLTFDDFINGIVAVLEDMSDQPMVFVGSSFGAIVAYEVSCRLKRPPEALLVIGSRTPDPENMRFTYHQMSDDMLNTQLKAMGSPEKEVLVIDNTLLRSAKDALRAVSQLAESYTSTSKLLTGCKVISIWPQEDTTVSCRQQQSWENLVPSDLYEFHSIKGGHRVLLDDPKEIFTIANVSSLVEVLVADR